MRRQAISFLIATFGVAAISASAWAHHSMSMFEDVKLVTIEGTVHSLNFRNPHIFVEVEVPTSDGKTEIWSIEGGGAAQSVNAGITAQALKVGSKVKIIAHPPKDPATRHANMVGIESNGRYYSRGALTNIRK